MIGFQAVSYTHLEHRFAVHLKMAGIRAGALGPDAALGPVGTQQTGVWMLRGKCDHRRTGPVPEEHAGASVGEIQHLADLLGADDQGVFDVVGCQQSPGGVQSV